MSAPTDPLHGHSEHPPVRVPPWNDADPYTDAMVLCDDDGIVRGGLLHHGKDYVCTGHAHVNGMHIRCLSPGHPEGFPRRILDALSPFSDYDQGLT